MECSQHERQKHVARIRRSAQEKLWHPVAEAEDFLTDRNAACTVSRIFDLHLQDALRMLREKPKPKLRKMIKVTSAGIGHISALLISPCRFDQAKWVSSMLSLDRDDDLPVPSSLEAGLPGRPQVETIRNRLWRKIAQPSGTRTVWTMLGTTDGSLGLGHVASPPLGRFAGIRGLHSAHQRARCSGDRRCLRIGRTTATSALLTVQRGSEQGTVGSCMQRGVMSCLGLRFGDVNFLYLQTEHEEWLHHTHPQTTSFLERVES